MLKCLRKLLDEGRAGENIGALLRGTKREEIERGQVLAKPGSITPHRDFGISSVRMGAVDSGCRRLFISLAIMLPSAIFCFRNRRVTGTRCVTFS